MKPLGFLPAFPGLARKAKASAAPDGGPVSAAPQAPSAAQNPPAAVPRRPSNREQILDAAEAVARDAGAAHLTLDAVSERAGVSKGGLLYHFKSKEALLQAMIDRHMRGVGERHAAALAALPPGPGRELKAFVHTMANHEKCAADKRAGCSMLAAAANDPRLLEPFHRFQQWRLQIVRDAAASGLPFERAAVASLALDGLALLELHGLSPYDAKQRRAILNDLLLFIDETVAAAQAAPAADVTQTRT